ncbi:MAG: hypothetical protein MUF84_01545 [Anaerolineae bacterium]|jgi:hypothetical protein|nr:hypothetical protein [Anaerolineae bacterium]
MSNVISQALWLTIVGMGMTFLSIGALVGGIFLLTHLTRAKENAPSTLTEPTQSATGGTPAVSSIWDAPDAEIRRRAVAAAVGVAMALTAQVRVEPAVDLGVTATDAWSAYVRGQQLSSRSRYESRRHSH